MGFFLLLDGTEGELPRFLTSPQITSWKVKCEHNVVIQQEKDPKQTTKLVLNLIKQVSFTVLKSVWYHCIVGTPNCTYVSPDPKCLAHMK